MPWWLTQMIPMMTKLIAYAAYDGHWWARSCPRRPGRDSGTAMFNTRSVMAMAKTPSLNASTRVVCTAPAYGPSPEQDC